MVEQAEREHAGWFSGLDVGDITTASGSLRDGTAEHPEDWPEIAVDTGFVDSTDAYFELLHDIAIATARQDVTVREQADDQQIKHIVRTIEDYRRTANELSERLAEWAGIFDEDPGAGIEYARTIVADSTFEDNIAIRSLAQRVIDLDDDAVLLETKIEQQLPAVAPNLTAIAGPLLSARLISHAGSLKVLARKPSGTVQVLGAEDALFAHLQTGSPPPKHGVIYTHEAVRHANPSERGPIARTLAGKLSIAARIDYYSGERDDAFIEEAVTRIRKVTGGDGQ